MKANIKEMCLTLAQLKEECQTLEYQHHDNQENEDSPTWRQVLNLRQRIMELELELEIIESDLNLSPLVLR